MNNQHENYLDGQYVGAFTVEKPFGPHVRKCVCDRCRAAFNIEFEKSMEESRKRQETLTPEQRANRKRIVDEVIAYIRNNPAPKPVPKPASVRIGDRVVFRGSSINDGRIGTVVEMPGPSNKYGGRPAERIEVLLDATCDEEWETVWTDNNQYSWLELTIQRND